MSADTAKTAGLSLCSSLIIHALALGAFGFGVSQWRAEIPAAPPIPRQEESVDLAGIVTEPLPEETAVVEEIEPPPPPPETKEPERFARVSDQQESDRAPDKADFVSDRNSIAASELPPSEHGEEGMPTMRGERIPSDETANRNLQDGELSDRDTAAAMAAANRPPPSPPEPIKTDHAAPTPPASVEKPDRALQDPPGQPVMVAKAIPVEPMEIETADDAHASAQSEADDARAPAEPKSASQPPTMSAQPEEPARSSPPPQPAVADPVADPAFRAFTRTREVEGSISNRGLAAVNAEATRTGKYTKEVLSRIERLWHIKRRQKADFANVGSLKIRFYVNRAGRPEDVEIVRNESNPVMTDFTLSAVLEAELPPMPDDLPEILEGGRLEISLDVLIY